MDHGAILLPVNIAERHPAAPADTVPRTTVRIPIPRVRGASTAIPSTGVQKPAPAAARRPMTMPTTAIPTVHGRRQMMFSTSAAKPAPFAAIARRSMAITRIPTQMVFVMIVAQMSR